MVFFEILAFQFTSPQNDFIIYYIIRFAGKHTHIMFIELNRRGDFSGYGHPTTGNTNEGRLHNDISGHGANRFRR